MKEKGEYIIKMKYINILVVVLFISALLPQVYAGDLQNDGSDEGYIIDQTQTEEGGWYFSIDDKSAAAQSFTPSMTPLAKVRLYIQSNNPSNPQENYPLKVSIRDDLDGEDLTSVTVDKEKMFDEYSWVNFDFEDITVQLGSTYYMVVESLSSGGEYWWAMYSSEDIDKYESGEAWARVTDNGVVHWVNFSGCSDFCFKTYGYAGRDPDLSCDGIIGLPDQTPGSTVTADFTVQNVGDEDSLLNWEIASYPEWGNWSFDPIEGADLKPEDGKFSVEVIIDVPNEKNADFSGEITIVNKDNESDTDTVSVIISTPKNKGFHWNLFNWLPLDIQRFLTHIFFVKLLLV